MRKYDLIIDMENKVVNIEMQIRSVIANDQHQRVGANLTSTERHCDPEERRGKQSVDQWEGQMDIAVMRTDCRGFVPQPRNDGNQGMRTDCFVVPPTNDNKGSVIANAVKQSDDRRRNFKKRNYRLCSVL